MDQYLSLAESVLRVARRPLSAREILREAYLQKKVPHHLYGRTQHKTLGARLSEDILLRRDRSLFFRTIPGYFFLREFLSDESVPDEFRSPIVSRRRARELLADSMLCFALSDLDSKALPYIDVGTVLSLLESNKYHYSDRGRTIFEALVWSFVVVCRDAKILTYRIGRYRDDRDTFLQKRTVGFFRAVRETDRTLFDQEDHGILSSGVLSAGLDLDLPKITLQGLEYKSRARLDCFLLHKPTDKPPSLLAVARFECPDWFEPTRRRLAINDLQWLDLDVPQNHLDDFDPWSQLVLTYLRASETKFYHRRAT
jgi:hypothetical protein